MKYLITLFANTLSTICIAQNIGDKVTFPATDGKTYWGEVKEIQGDKYKIKYDGVDFEAWLAKNQFTVVNSKTSAYSSVGPDNNLLGSKVSFKGTDGKTYTAVISEIRGDQYKIKYDAYDFEALRPVIESMPER